jgi:23S rRNA pseudouridine2604 synthase
MCLALGYRVITLHRTRIMHITVNGLGAGRWKELTSQEREQLLKAVGRPQTRSSSSGTSGN